MNELMIVLENGNWLYFKTKYGTTEWAYRDFESVCKATKIDIDNLKISKLILRNEDGEDIEKKENL